MLGENLDEHPLVNQVRAVAQAENARMLVISAKVEEEIAQLDPEEKQAFLEDLGIGESGLDRLEREAMRCWG
jgi:ribosome-binding ATPase YchF (GTP1/OBG family)